MLRVQLVVRRLAKWLRAGWPGTGGLIRRPGLPLLLHASQLLRLRLLLLLYHLCFVKTSTFCNRKSGFLIANQDSSIEIAPES